MQKNLVPLEEVRFRNPIADHVAIVVTPIGKGPAWSQRLKSMYEIGYTQYDAGGRWVSVNYDAACKILLAGPSIQEQEQWLQADLEEAGLIGRPRFCLQAWPNSEAEVRNLHSQTAEGFRYILTHPTVIRDIGFGMVNGGQAALRPGGGVGVKLVLSNLGGEEKGWSLSLQQNGLLTWVVPAGSAWLSHGDGRHRPQHCINPVALIESVLEFVQLFIQKILPSLTPSPVSWSIHAKMDGLHADVPYSSLQRGLTSIPLPIAPEAAPHDSIIAKPLVCHDESAGRVAFLLLKQLYAGFGHDESAIPLVQGGEVKPELILGLR